jgi:hypothetical protein
MSLPDHLDPRIEPRDHLDLRLRRVSLSVLDVTESEDDEPDDERSDKLGPEEGEPLEDGRVKDDGEEPGSIERISSDGVPMIENEGDGFADGVRVV